jgi:hypothetical protein
MTNTVKDRFQDPAILSQVGNYYSDFPTVDGKRTILCAYTIGKTYGDPTTADLAEIDRVFLHEANALKTASAHSLRLGDSVPLRNVKDVSALVGAYMFEVGFHWWWVIRWVPNTGEQGPGGSYAIDANGATSTAPGWVTWGAVYHRGDADLFQIHYADTDDNPWYGIDLNFILPSANRSLPDASAAVADSPTQRADD